MSDTVTADRLQAVARITGHRFADPGILEQGLTHASACSHLADAQARRSGHNERLEFLGDAFLGAAVAYLLYQRFPASDEGFLSRCKSQLVSRKTLARAFDHHQLLPHAILGGQMSSGVPSSVRANLAEGLLGAILLDGGWPALCTAVNHFLSAEFEQVANEPRSDAKNALQMWCLEHYRLLPTYECQRCGGSDHAPRFQATVRIQGSTAQAEGGSRRGAETRAAADLLAQLQALASDQEHELPSP